MSTTSAESAKRLKKKAKKSFAEVKNGKKKLGRAVKEMKQETERKRLSELVAAREEHTNGDAPFGLRVCAVAAAVVEPDSLGVIVTDPPYNAEGVESYRSWRRRLA